MVTLHTQSKYFQILQQPINAEHMLEKIFESKRKQSVRCIKLIKNKVIIRNIALDR